MLWMTAYHFCFDLNHFGYLSQSFNTDPFWLWQRSAIVSLFLFTAGLGQAIAVSQQQSWRRFWRRWLQVAGCALLVTAASLVMFPRSYIYFGVLHGLAVMLLIARFSAGWGRWLWWLGALAVVLPTVFGAIVDAQGWPAVYAWLDLRSLNWLGLISRKPFTEDYVPLLPWLGVMWWGVAAGNAVQKSAQPWLKRQPGLIGQKLAVLGRWSLSYYMVHQPVMIGVLTGIAALK